jgi:hypothetical protein
MAMTVEVKTNYLGIINGSSKKVEPNPNKPIVLAEFWPPYSGPGRYSEIKVVNDWTIIHRAGHMSTTEKDDRDPKAFGEVTLNEDEINAAKLETKRDSLGRKKIFSYRP